MRQVRKRVVIVGAGFAGLTAAKHFKSEPVDVWVIDKNNYHLFQPLLYQVATAGLEPEQIAKPIRAILQRQRNLSFLMTEVVSFNLDEKYLETIAGPVRYDYLIVAPGSQISFFGRGDVLGPVLKLKTLDDAVTIRNHLLRQFELASREVDSLARQSLLTFAVAGGGPSGVETAGAISELIRLVLVKDYRSLDMSEVQILLLEAGSEILAAFPSRLREEATRQLDRKGVQVVTGRSVEKFDGSWVHFQDGSLLETKTLIWSAGAEANPLVESLGVERKTNGRALVTPNLHLHGYPEVFLVGDAAYVEGLGDSLPMMAPVAVQMGERAVKNILRHIRQQPMQPFHFKDPGSLATIGRNAAVARIGEISFHGFLAWLVWLVVHLVQLIGFRNRIAVLLNWAWDYFFYDRGVRLITDNDGERKIPSESTSMEEEFESDLHMQESRLLRIP